MGLVEQAADIAGRDATQAGQRLHGREHVGLVVFALAVHEDAVTVGLQDEQRDTVGRHHREHRNQVACRDDEEQQRTDQACGATRGEDALFADGAQARDDQHERHDVGDGDGEGHGRNRTLGEMQLLLEVDDLEQVERKDEIGGDKDHRQQDEAAVLV